MTLQRLLVVGAGGHGRSVAEAAELSGQFEVVGFLDDALPAGISVVGFPVLGALASMAQHQSVVEQAVVAVGNNAVREKLMMQLTPAPPPHCLKAARNIHLAAFFIGKSMTYRVIATKGRY